jgi:hypothetical protein
MSSAAAISATRSSSVIRLIVLTPSCGQDSSIPQPPL